MPQLLKPKCLKPMLCNKGSRGKKPVCLSQRAVPARHERAGEKPSHSNEDPAQPKRTTRTDYKSSLTEKEQGRPLKRKPIGGQDMPHNRPADSVIILSLGS